MGAWAHGIFGDDDAGDMSDTIGDFVGIKGEELSDDFWNDDGCSACDPSGWNSKFAKSMKTGFEANMDGFLEFVAAGYKIRRKRFKDLSSACSYDDEGVFGMILAALVMNAGADMPAIVKRIGLNAIANELADTERLEDWNDYGMGRIRVLNAFKKKLTAYKGGRRIKIV